MIDMSDKRKPWKYDGCEIIPESGPTRYFGHPDWQPGSSLPLHYSKWWRVKFPNGTWCLCADKARCIGYIHSPNGRSQGGLTDSMPEQAAA